MESLGELQVITATCHVSRVSLGELEVMFQQVSRVKPAHSAQNIEQALGGAGLPVPGLPQVEDGLSRAGPEEEKYLEI